MATNYQLWKVFEPDWRVSQLMEVKIVCSCGNKTTRAECVDKPSFYDDIVFHNYHCPECDKFLRCDATPTPLPQKVKNVTVVIPDDDETDSVQNLRDML